MEYFIIVNHNFSKKASSVINPIIIQYNNKNVQEIVNTAKKYNCVKNVTNKESIVYSDSFDACFQVKKHLNNFFNINWEAATSKIFEVLAAAQINNGFRLPRMHITEVLQKSSKQRTQISYDLPSSTATSTGYLNQNVYHNKINGQNQVGFQIDTGMFNVQDKSRYSSLDMEPRQFIQPQQEPYENVSESEPQGTGDFFKYFGNDEDIQPQVPSKPQTTTFIITDQVIKRPTVQDQCQQNFQEDLGLPEETIELSYPPLKEITKFLKTVAGIGLGIKEYQLKSKAKEKHVFEIKFPDGELAEYFIQKLQAFQYDDWNFNYGHFQITRSSLSILQDITAIAKQH